MSHLGNDIYNEMCQEFIEEEIYAQDKDYRQLEIIERYKKRAIILKKWQEFNKWLEIGIQQQILPNIETVAFAHGFPIPKGMFLAELLTKSSYLFNEINKKILEEKTL